MPQVPYLPNGNNSTASQEFKGNTRTAFRIRNMEAFDERCYLAHTE